MIERVSTWEDTYRIGDFEVKRLRTLSYNIHKGFSIGNQDYVLDLIKKSIQHFHVDLVLLQEVVGEHEKHFNQAISPISESQFEFLADGVWSHFAYGKNAVYDQGHHGNAILSLHPILESQNLNLSTNRWESRGLLHATLDMTLDKKIHAMSLHLDLFERGRQLQIQKACEYINQNTQADDIVILGGDFNDWGKKASHKIKSETSLEEAFFQLHGTYAKTFPSLIPILSLDRIYTRNLTPVNAQCLRGPLWKKLSDHLPILAEFEY